jgi:hypothetical protein
MDAAGRPVRRCEKCYDYKSHQIKFVPDNACREGRWNVGQNDASRSVDRSTLGALTDTDVGETLSLSDD